MFAKSIKNYTIDELKKEISRRELARTIFICSTCHRPCGAGGCHGDGFRLKVTKELAKRVAELEFSEKDY